MDMKQASNYPRSPRPARGVGLRVSSSSISGSDGGVAATAILNSRSSSPATSPKRGGSGGTTVAVVLLEVVAFASPPLISTWKPPELCHRPCRGSSLQSGHRRRWPRRLAQPEWGEMRCCLFYRTKLRYWYF